MDYLFVTLNDTKSRIKARYGKDVSEESVDTEATGESASADDIVTQVICYYKNARGLVGCFSWAGDTVLIDDSDYEARKDKVCEACGRTKPQGERRCVCGGDRWEKRPKDYEILGGDIPREDGTVIPGLSPARGEDGSYVMEDYEAQAVDPGTGYPLYDYILQDGIPVGEVPRMVTKQRPRMEPTKIPYYYPRKYPVLVRKNISKTGAFLGGSDCDVVRDFQIEANKQLTKMEQKLLKPGSFVTKPESLRMNFSDRDLVELNLKSPAEAQMIRTLDLSVDISQHTVMVDKLYYMAKSVLGVTDSYQGKPDSTAQSGRAKEAQIAQAAGRQRSKRVMKNAAYADLYEMIFKFMLAYADEPRTYTSTDRDGRQVEKVFCRYDFLEQDENGNWYYDDQYLFSVDESGVDMSDRRMMLEDLHTDLGLGAYGDPGEPETMLAYWKEKELMGYPNAARNIQRWEKKAEEARAAAMQAAVGQEGGTPYEMPQVQNGAVY